MNRNDVVAALVRKYPDAGLLMTQFRTPMPRVLDCAIIDMWVRQTPEDADSAILRAAKVLFDNGGVLP